MTSAGPAGEIRWSYLPAVIFGPWHASLHPAGGTVTAQIVSVDAYRASQAPLSLTLPFGRQIGRWPVLILQIEGASLTATVGPRERS